MCTRADCSTIVEMKRYNFWCVREGRPASQGSDILARGCRQIPRPVVAPHFSVISQMSFLERHITVLTCWIVFFPFTSGRSHWTSGPEWSDSRTEPMAQTDRRPQSENPFRLWGRSAGRKIVPKMLRNTLPAVRRCAKVVCSKLERIFEHHCCTQLETSRNATNCARSRPQHPTSIALDPGRWENLARSGR